MIRQRLPQRRPAVSETVTAGARHYQATVGFDLAGQPREVFLGGAQDGSELAAILADAAIVVSIALQYGIPAAELGRSLSRLPSEYGATGESRPASPIGAALDLLARWTEEMTPTPAACPSPQPSPRLRGEGDDAGVA